MPALLQTAVSFNISYSVNGKSSQFLCLMYYTRKSRIKEDCQANSYKDGGKKDSGFLFKTTNFNFFLKFNF